MTGQGAFGVYNDGFEARRERHEQEIRAAFLTGWDMALDEAARAVAECPDLHAPELRAISALKTTAPRTP